MGHIWSLYITVLCWHSGLAGNCSKRCSIVSTQYAFVSLPWWTGFRPGHIQNHCLLPVPWTILHISTVMYNCTSWAAQGYEHADDKAQHGKIPLFQSMCRGPCAWKHVLWSNWIKSWQDGRFTHPVWEGQHDISAMTSCQGNL